MVRPDGSRLVRIFEEVGDGLNVSPDGRLVATRFDKDLHILDADSGTDTRAVTFFRGGFQDWRGDSRRLLYLRTGIDRVPEAFSSDIDGANQTRHPLPVPGDLGAFRRLPGSNRVVAFFQGDSVSTIWTADLDGPSLSPVVEFPGDISIVAPSPDGERIAYLARFLDEDIAHVRMTDRDGVADRLLVSLYDLDSDVERRFRSVRELVWSADGSRMGFKVGSQEIWVVGVESGDGPRRVTVDVEPYYLRGFDFSPEGRRLAYAVDRELRLAELDDPADFRVVAIGTGEFAWRPVSVNWVP